MSVSIAVVASNAEVVERLARLLEVTGHRVCARAIVRTRKSELASQLKTWIADPAIQLVVGINGATMRSALLPQITKRLIALTDLQDIDGGQCDSTLVLLVPKAFSLETLAPSLERVERELAGRGRRRTEPPPPPRPRRPTSSIAVSRPRAKTAPPPLPIREEPDFIITHRRSADAEFADQVAALRPIRLEPLPVVVRPIPQPPRSHRRHNWLAVGAAIVCGALAGTVLRAASSSTTPSDSAVAPASPRATPSLPPAPPPPEGATVDVRHEPPLLLDNDVAEAIEMPALRVRKRAEVPLWKLFTDKPVRRASRSGLHGTNPPRAPSKRREPIQVISAAQRWNSGGSAKPCDVIACALDQHAHPCCERFRMSSCATSGVQLAPRPGCDALPRR